MGIVLQSAGDLTGALVTPLLAVAVFALVGWLVIRLASGRMGFGRVTRGELQVVERLPLDFKSSLYVVRGMGRTWLVGSAEGSAPRLIAELDGDAHNATAADGNGPEGSAGA